MVRRIFENKKHVYWVIGFLVVLIILGLVIPPLLAVRASVNQGVAFKASRVISLESWFRAEGPAKKYHEYENNDYTFGQRLEAPPPPPRLKGEKEFTLRRRSGERASELVINISLWQSDRAYAVLSLEVRPVE